MARGGGRDITLSLVTDLSRFEPDRAAEDLEDLERSAERVGDALDEASDRAERAGRGFDSVGEGASRAARDTDESMDEIRDTSREAANEIASGFDGSFDSVIDGLQGMVSEFGLAFGPAAMAGFMAAAAAMGAVWSRIQEGAEMAKERVKRLEEGISTVVKAGGDLSQVDLSDFVEGLDPDEVSRFVKDAEELGVAAETIARAHAGDAEASREVQRAYRDRIAAMGDLEAAGHKLSGEIESRLGVESDSLFSDHQLSIATRELADETSKANETLRARAALTGGLTEAQRELNASLQETMESIGKSSDDVSNAAASSAGSVIAAAQAQADATEDMSDSWADFSGASREAADEIIAEQHRQIEQLTEFQANVQAVLEKGGEDLVAWANSQDDAAAAMAAAAKMTPDQAREIGSNYRQTVELAGDDMIKGADAALSRTKDSGGRAGREAADAYASGFAKQVKSPGNQRKMADAARVTPQPSPWLNTPQPTGARRNP